MLKHKPKTPLMGRPSVRPPPKTSEPVDTQKHGELPSPKVWGKPTWDVIWNSVKKLEFLEKNEPPAEILAEEKQRLQMWFLGLPSALPCWDCTQHTLELYSQKAPDVSSGKALREWVTWLQDEVNKHVKAKKEATASLDNPVTPMMVPFQRRWVPKTCSQC